MLGGWRVHDERRVGSKLAHYARNACHLVMAAGERARDTFILKRVLTAAQQVRPTHALWGLEYGCRARAGAPRGGVRTCSQSSGALGREHGRVPAHQIRSAALPRLLLAIAAGA